MFRLFVDYHWKYGSFCRFWPLKKTFLWPKLLKELKGLLLQKKLYSSLHPAIIFVSKISQHRDVSGWKNFFGRYFSFLILNYCATCRCFSVIDTSKHSPCSIFSIDTIFVSKRLNTSLWERKTRNETIICGQRKYFILAYAYSITVYTTAFKPVQPIHLPSQGKS